MGLGRRSCYSCYNGFQSGAVLLQPRLTLLPVPATTTDLNREPSEAMMVPGVATVTSAAPPSR